MINTSDELQVKACKDIKDNMSIEVTFDRTYIVVLAISNNSSKNSLTKISCRKGVPISGYLYDAQSDAYYVDCHEHLLLGFIPVSFLQTMLGVANWTQRIPMPEAAIRRYLSQQQKRDLRKFKMIHKDHKFHFMQIIDCYSGKNDLG